MDYQKLKKITKKDAYPMPQAKDLIQKAISKAFYTILNLVSRYWQVLVNAEDTEKTAFTTPISLFKFLMMPFSLCNTPAMFQRMMDEIFGKEGEREKKAYLDNVLQADQTIPEHFSNLKKL